MNRPIPVALSVLTLTLLAAFPAQAQTAPGTGQTDTASLPRVEVSAEKDKGYVVKDSSAGTKTDTPLMETPLSIQVIPQQVLQDQKVTTLDQALTNVSGVRSQNLGAAAEQIWLRGFPTYTTFRNGFRIDVSAGSGTLAMTNVDELEVLKGPAAILYGRVEPGGIVNIVTKQPQSTPAYSIEQSVGSWDHYVTNVDATGPINDDKSVLYRINGSFDKSASWRDQVHNERLFIAPTLQWKISPQTQIKLEAEMGHNPMTFDAFQQAPYDAATNQIIWLPRDRNLTNAPITIDNTHLGLDWSHQFNDDWSIKHQIVHNKAHDFGMPYYVAAFNQTGSAWTVDRNLISFPYIDTQTDATILDLTGHFETAGMKHTLLLGADYYRFKPSYIQSMSSTFSTTDAFNPAPPSGLVIDPTMYAQVDSTTNNLGVYVQDQVKLTRQWQALLGFRYQKVDRVGQSKSGTGFGGNDQFVADLPQHDSATTPRFGVLWQPRDSLSLYANYAENFGANNGRDWQGQALQPESAKQKEIGAKSQFFDGKLTSTVALFELAKTNVAVCDLIHDPLCQAGVMMTIGEIRSRGLESDLQGEIQPGWDVTASYTYTDIIVSKSTPGSGYVQGNRMANVPRNMLNLWSTYELKGEALHGWKIGGGLAAYSFSTDSSNKFNSPGYAVFNAMTSYEFKTSNRHSVTAQLNINNLLNRQYLNQLTAWGNTAGFTYGTPRSAMASLKIEF